MQQNRRILLIIAGGIAAYKTLELIRRLREREFAVRCIVTRAGAEFVTPLAVASLSGERVFTDLFSLTDEAEIGHIRLSREADLVVVAPATADLIAKMAHGLADDLASTALLATDKPVLIAPAMNPAMWEHPATRRSIAQVQADGVRLVGPNPGDMACGETGLGRMAEPDQMVEAIEHILAAAGRAAPRPARAGDERPHGRGDRPGALHRQPLVGQAGPRDRRRPGRCGRRGRSGEWPGARTGPRGRERGAGGIGARNARGLRGGAAGRHRGVRRRRGGLAGAASSRDKIKKRPDGMPPTLVLAENPDILKTLSHAAARPRLVVGFAAETGNVVANGRRKLATKGCDWIVANDVSREQATFGSVYNTVQLIRSDAEVETWPKLAKAQVASRLVTRIATHFASAPAAAA